MKAVIGLLLLLTITLLSACSSEPTPEPTSAPPAETPVPVSDTSAPDPTAAPEPTATPEELIIPLGPEIRHIDPKLWGLMYEHARGVEAPEGVAVEIHVFEGNPKIELGTPLGDWLADVGARRLESDYAWCLPTKHLAPLAQRSDISGITEAYGPSASGIDPTVEARMSGSLVEVLSAYQGGGVEDKTACDPSASAPAR